jgi:hypothetical protein
MEYSANSYFLALSLMLIVPAALVVALLGLNSDEASETPSVPFDLVSTISMVGMAVICIHYRSEIFFVANL